LHIYRRRGRNAGSSCISGESNPIVFHERIQVITFGQKEESTESSGVPGKSSPIVFHKRRQVITFGQKVGKECTVSSDVPGESSPIVFHERRQVCYNYAESGKGEQFLQVYLESPAQSFSTRGDRFVVITQKVGKESSFFRCTWRVQPNRSTREDR
jgi:hypothetical protein